MTEIADNDLNDVIMIMIMFNNRVAAAITVQH